VVSVPWHGCPCNDTDQARAWLQNMALDQSAVLHNGAEFVVCLASRKLESDAAYRFECDRLKDGSETAIAQFGLVLWLASACMI
jgi:hypothetical protein